MLSKARNIFGINGDTGSKKKLLHYDKFLEVFDKELIQILKSMMSFNPYDRPSAE